MGRETLIDLDCIRRGPDCVASSALVFVKHPRAFHFVKFQKITFFGIVSNFSEHQKLQQQMMMKRITSKEFLLLRFPMYIEVEV